MYVRFENLKEVYNSEIRKNVRNKKKLFDFEKNKIEYLCYIKKCLENLEYDGGKYSIFLIYKPKIRVVMSQNVLDKTINHYITRYILIPKFEKYLSPRNCATRKNMGSSYAIKLLKKILNLLKSMIIFIF